MPLTEFQAHAIIYVVSSLIDSLTRKPKSRFENYQQNSSGKPTIEKGNPVPVIWGHNNITSPLLIYAGNYAFQGESYSFLVDGETWYSVAKDGRVNGTAAFALCRGPLVAANEDGLLRVRIGGKPTLDEIAGGTNWCRTNAGAGVSYGTQVTDEVHIKDRDLFGGMGYGGGVQWDGRIILGADDETEDADFTAACGASISETPALRGISWLWITDYIGKGPLLPAYEFEVRRCPNNLSLTGDGHLVDHDDNASGIFDANPAEILYEILTDTDFGLGLTTSEVDTASFQTAGNTLYDEDFGMSMIWDGLSPIRNVIEEVLRTIGAVLYQANDDGKINIQLLRSADSSQLTITESNAASVEMQQPLWSGRCDNIVVEYPLRTSSNLIERASVTANDPSRFAWGSGGITTKIYYEAIRIGDIAEKIALRDLRILTTPARRFRVNANREAWTLNPGDVVTLTWSDYGVTSLRCRVDTIDYGSLENGIIRVELIEDVFDQTAAAFTSDEGDWIEDDAEPGYGGYGYNYGNQYGGGI